MSDRLQRIRLETGRHSIEGSLQLPVDGFRSRLTDFLNAHARDFIALTDAIVSPLEGDAPRTTHEFLTVSTGHVVLVVELEAPDIP
jgi:hypothetical protein